MDRLSGTMVKYLKDNGRMELKMVMVLGDLQKETTMKETGC
mgnify:FL=1